MSDKPKARLEKKRGHIIYKLADGTRVPGASTICRIGGDMEFVIKWANEQGLQGLSHKAVRDESADIGTLAHWMNQCHVLGNEPDLSEWSADAIDAATNAHIKFIDFWESEGLSAIGIEIPLVSEKYGYGGTLDMVASDPQGRICLVDYKTGKRVYEEAYFQVAAYKHLYEENKDIPIDRCLVFRIGKKEKGDSQIIPLPYDLETHFNVFLAQLNLYNMKKRLKN